MTRRFSDEEVALILRDATRLEGGSAPGDGRRPLPPGDGLSLVELKEIAAEAGIDPTAVEQAALSLAGRPRQSPFRIFLGADSQVRVLSEFKGSLDDRALGEALQEIRSFVTVQGASNALPSGIEWTARDDWGPDPFQSPQRLTVLVSTSGETSRTLPGELLEALPSLPGLASSGPSPQ